MGRTSGVQLCSVPWALVRGAVAPGGCLGPQTPWCPWGTGAYGPSSWVSEAWPCTLLLRGWACILPLALEAQTGKRNMGWAGQGSASLCGR